MRYGEICCHGRLRRPVNEARNRTTSPECNDMFDVSVGLLLRPSYRPVPAASEKKQIIYQKSVPSVPAAGTNSKLVT